VTTLSDRFPAPFRSPPTTTKAHPNSSAIVWRPDQVAARCQFRIKTSDRSESLKRTREQSITRLQATTPGRPPPIRRPRRVDSGLPDFRLIRTEQNTFDQAQTARSSIARCGATGARRMAEDVFTLLRERLSACTELYGRIPRLSEFVSISMSLPLPAVSRNCALTGSGRCAGDGCLHIKYRSARLATTRRDPVGDARPLHTQG